jgi:hypothetical protein
VEGWDKTPAQVMRELMAARGDRVSAITPVVGPEAVTGSSRMKGGSGRGGGVIETCDFLTNSDAGHFRADCRLRHAQLARGGAVVVVANRFVSAL